MGIYHDKYEGKKDTEYNLNLFMSALLISILSAIWQTFDENAEHHLQSEMVKKQ